jgi:hypothetical protein
MRIGFSELFTIGAVIMLLLGAGRIFVGRNSAPPPAPKGRPLTATEARDAAILRGRRNGLKGWGLVVLALGIIFFLGSFGVFNYFFVWLRWGGLLIVLGLILLFLPRRSAS